MTVSDMRCDVCGRALSGPAPAPGLPRDNPGAGVRFTYHPGDPRMRDDSGLLCCACWQGWADRLGPRRRRVCATCGTSVRRRASLHLRRADEHDGWQLCTPDAAALLNTLRTVRPKLDPATFRLPLDTLGDDEGGSGG